MWLLCPTILKAYTISEYLWISLCNHPNEKLGLSFHKVQSGSLAPSESKSLLHSNKISTGAHDPAGCRAHVVQPSVFTPSLQR